MGESTPIEKITTRMIPMIFVAGYCVMGPYKHMIKRMFRPGLIPILWYVMFGVACGLTSAQPALCLWKGAEILITMMWICVSCRDKESTKTELLALTKYVEILLWVTVFLAIINPSMGTMASASIIPWIRGYLPILNPNAIGFLSVAALTRLMFLPARFKVVRMVLVLGTLLCAQSRTSYAVTLLALLIFIFDSLKKKNLFTVVVSSFFALMALTLTMGWMDLLLQIVTRGESTEEIRTLSGRTDYWAFAFEHISWMGNGLAVGSRSFIFLEDHSVFAKSSINTHNSFVEALVGAGYIGAVPFIALIVMNIIRQLVGTVRRFESADAIFCVYAVMFAARGMTSIVLAIFSFDFILLMMFWAWIWTSSQTFDSAGPKPRPKPVVYEKTLHEQSLDQTTG